MKRGLRLLVLVALLLPLSSSVTPSSAGPDGDSEILVLSRNKLGQHGCHKVCTHISVLNPSTESSREVISEQDILEAQWSPDRTRIAFSARQAQSADPIISIVESDGSNPFNLGMSGYGEGQLDWSPDGSQLVFTHFDVESFYGSIYRRRTNVGSGPHRISQGPRCVCDNPVWSPDGELIAHRKGDGIAIKRRGGWLLREIKPKGISLRDPVWFPGGKRLLVRGYIESRDTGEVFIVRVKKGSPKQITGRPSLHELDMSFSPDGTKLVFVRSDCGWDCDYDIWTMDSNGANATRLAGSNNGEVSPVWSPDGTRIAFSGYGGTGYDYDLYTMNADGTDKKVVFATDQDDYAKGWGSK